MHVLKRVIEYHVLSNGIYIASSNVCGITFQPFQPDS